MIDFARRVPFALLAAFGLALLTSVAAAAGPRGDFTQSLFNGVDLAGWHIEEGQFDVDDGLLIADGEGWLRSDWQYDDFVFHVEWRAPEKEYDGGILFKAAGSGAEAPEKAYRISLAATDVGSVPGVTGATPAGVTVHPPGEWNAFELTCLGPIGELKINNRVGWRVSNLDPRAGFFGLLAGGGRIEFRNLLIRELGYRSLGNGEDLEGWQPIGFGARWAVEDGIMSGTPSESDWLSTAKEYANFVLRLEYRVRSGGKGGVAVRTPRFGAPAYQGIEVPLLDARADNEADRPATQTSGGLYDVVAPTEPAARPAGEWNQLEVRAQDRRVQVTLNGKPTVDTDLDTLGLHFPNHPGLIAKRGYLGLRAYTPGVEFRNLRLRELR
jgi:hypothetical protein